WAALVHPGPAGAPAYVLPGRDRLPAAPAVLAGGARRVLAQPRRCGARRAEPDRAGTGDGKADAPRAEMLQMRLTHPLVDLHSPRSRPGRRLTQASAAAQWAGTSGTSSDRDGHLWKVASSS